MSARQPLWLRREPCNICSLDTNCESACLYVMKRETKKGRTMKSRGSRSSFQFPPLRRGTLKGAPLSMHAWLSIRATLWLHCKIASCVLQTVTTLCRDKLKQLEGTEFRKVFSWAGPLKEVSHAKQAIQITFHVSQTHTLQQSRDREYKNISIHCSSIYCIQTADAI